MYLTFKLLYDADPKNLQIDDVTTYMTAYMDMDLDIDLLFCEN